MAKLLKVSEPLEDGDTDWVKEELVELVMEGRVVSVVDIIEGVPDWLLEEEEVLVTDRVSERDVVVE